MTKLPIEARTGLRYSVASLAAIVAVLTITSEAADARHHRRLRVHYVAAHHAVNARHHARAEEYAPPQASIVVDGNSGQVLQATNADAPRHPASLTKIMTLYLLFERLDAGKIKLDTPLKVSAHAADQDPTKLELKPGQTIAVEDAIKGVVTRSANDAAVVIAESIGGSESDFAKLMTQKARALGMSHTTYVNASGLPDDDQITTARDQALLGRAIQDRYPRYYKYFSIPAFVYHGVAIRNHDHLLSQVQGVDGIKTGFTRASGFNLVTSLHRDGRYVVGVVLGGRSASQRDGRMRDLITSHIKEAAVQRTAPAIVERDVPRDEAPPAAVAKTTTPTTVSRADPTPTASVAARVAVGSSDPIQARAVKTVSYRIAPTQQAALSPLPSLVMAPPAPQQDAAAPRQELPHTVVAAADTGAPITIPAVKSDPIKAEPSKIEPAKAEVAAVAFPAPEPVKAEPVKFEPPKAELPAPTRARGGWVIQIGAYPAEDEAKQHLSAARTKVRDKLAAADPFTERVLKGDTTLYRARFAGFDKETADAACRQLKRNDFDCITVRN
jgi:D-alanyl-D-alanine carboxypeptidase